MLSNTSSPTLTGKESRSPVDRNSLTSTGSEKPLDFKQQSRDRPAALDMVNSDLNSRLVLSTYPYYREYILYGTIHISPNSL